MPGSLEYVYAYALVTSDGVLLVDSGWSTDLAPLEALLREAGLRLADIEGVLLTHSHGDHTGLATRVRDETGARIALLGPEPPPDTLTTAEAERWCDRLGIPADERDAAIELALRFAGHRSELRPDRRLSDGEVIDAGSFSLEVIATPGHARDQACFVDRRRGFALTGDHILSQTTPNVSLYPGRRDSPLADYLRSLERTRALGPLLALPGHERRVQVDTRSEELIEHHEMQLARAAAMLAACPATIREVASEMPWSTPWARLSVLDRLLALCETHAHLVVLAERGVAEPQPDEPLWRIV
jgi:glyoxylase-like metal-dependent hydrolase (beta-lactamase superfamily II)